MKTTYPKYSPQYFTTTIYNWKHLLSKDEHKNIVIECLHFLVAQKRITLYGFVVMSNHVHIIWQPLPGFIPSTIQFPFTKHTSKQLKALLQKNDTEALATYKVDKYDRMHQIWKRGLLSVELRTTAVLHKNWNTYIIIPLWLV